jgi:ABC-type multidrug transport system ATPase subunit
MLALSRALTTEPRVFLLDELSVGLAPLVAEELLDVVHGLSSEGITTVRVEQLVSDALQIADNVLILDKGRVVFKGTPPEAEQLPRWRCPAADECPIHLAIGSCAGHSSGQIAARKEDILDIARESACPRYAPEPRPFHKDRNLQPERTVAPA